MPLLGLSMGFPNIRVGPVYLFILRDFSFSSNKKYAFTTFKKQLNPLIVTKNSKDVYRLLLESNMSKNQ